jgi:hypothetical protein
MKKCFRCQEYTDKPLVEATDDYMFATLCEKCVYQTKILYSDFNASATTKRIIKQVEEKYMEEEQKVINLKKRNYEKNIKPFNDYVEKLLTSVGIKVIRKDGPYAISNKSNG